MANEAPKPKDDKQGQTAGDSKQFRMEASALASFARDALNRARDGMHEAPRYKEDLAYCETQMARAAGHLEEAVKKIRAWKETLAALPD